MKIDRRPEHSDDADHEIYDGIPGGEGFGEFAGLVFRAAMAALTYKTVEKSKKTIRRTGNKVRTWAHNFGSPKND